MWGVSKYTSSKRFLNQGNKDFWIVGKFLLLETYISSDDDAKRGVTTADPLVEIVAVVVPDAFLDWLSLLTLFSFFSFFSDFSQNFFIFSQSWTQIPNDTFVLVSRWWKIGEICFSKNQVDGNLIQTGGNKTQNQDFFFLSFLSFLDSSANKNNSYLS